VISGVLNRIGSVWKNREVGFRLGNIINGRFIHSTIDINPTELADITSRLLNSIVLKNNFLLNPSYQDQD